MAFNKRSKFSRARGEHTHGCGSMKKRRGAGNRGGRGNAGTGKRGDCKKPRIWANPKYFGKHGFKKKGVKADVVYVNLNYLEDNCDNLVEQKLIFKEGDSYVLNGSELGFTKVLGYGKLTKKLNITAKSFSKGAIDKIKSAGGDAIVSKKASKSEAKPSQEEAKKPAEEAK